MVTVEETRNQVSISEANELSWGGYDLPLSITSPEVSLLVEKISGGYRYHRKGAGAEIEKIVLSNYGKLYLNPTEPLNTPKEITPYLLLEFSQPIIVDPKTSTDVYATVPLETACVFYVNETDFTIIDIFTLTQPKFTLYGSVSRGLVCKYWNTGVYFSVPPVDPRMIGIMELNIRNNSSRWVEISKAVFSAYGMKIYYKSNLVSLKASMRIINEETAETNFFDQPLEEGMQSSIELFSQNRLSFGSKMVMKEGY